MKVKSDDKAPAGWILYDDSCGVCRRWVPFWEGAPRRRGFDSAPLYEVPKPDGGTQVWLGYSGGCPGIKAVVAYAPEAGTFVAVALNNDGSAEATAHLLLKALKERSKLSSEDLSRLWCVR